MNRVKFSSGLSTNTLGYYCPGCQQNHSISVYKNKGSRQNTEVFDFNGSFERPTITPAIRIRGRESDYISCSHTITDGKITFNKHHLGCHDLEGQTIDIPFWNEIYKKLKTTEGSPRA